MPAAKLHQFFLQLSDRGVGGSFLVEDAVDGVGDRHVDIEFLVYLIDTCRRVVAFRHHRHLDHGAFYGVSLADHRSERPVAAEFRVAGDQQVAQIDRGVEVARRGVGALHEATHLHGAVGDEYRHEVVAVPQCISPRPGRRCS